MEKNIKKCYLQCAHTKTQKTVPVQISPTFSDSHDTFKCQWPKYVSQSQTQKLLPDFIWSEMLMQQPMAIVPCQQSN